MKIATLEVQFEDGTVAIAFPNKIIPSEMKSNDCKIKESITYVHYVSNGVNYYPHVEKVCLKTDKGVLNHALKNINKNIDDEVWILKESALEVLGDSANKGRIMDYIYAHGKRII